MGRVVISAENLGKMYHIGARRSGSESSLFNGLKAPFGYLCTHLKNLNSERSGFQSNFDETVLWALRNVSFEVREGEVLGVIGRNGAGKSTLLKLLSRITDPTEGRLRMKGRVNSLLEVGTGFHPELTGKENVYMNAAMHGMKRREIDRNMDEIIDFAEIEKFIDTPVKRYSSGMYTRLAFAVAAHLDPDILIIDEVLAVGDVAFQAKCIDKIGRVRDSGRTILFVSHNMTMIQKICSRGLVLSQGRELNAGPIEEMIQFYYHAMHKDRSVAITITPESGIEHVELYINGESSSLCENIDAGKAITISVRLTARHAIPLPFVDVFISKEDGTKIIVIEGMNAVPDRPSSQQCAWRIDYQLGKLQLSEQQLVFHVAMRINAYTDYDVLWNVAARPKVIPEHCPSRPYYAEYVLSPRVKTTIT